MNTFEQFGIPAEVSGAITIGTLAVSTVTLIACLLAPHQKSPIEIGPLKLPRITPQMRPRVAAIGACSFLIFAVCLALYLPQNKAEMTHQVKDTRSLERVLESHTPRLIEGKARLSSLSAYYKESNAGFSEAIERLRAKKEGAVYLLGAGGGGKSFLLRELEPTIPNRIELRKIVLQDPNCTFKPDLITSKGQEFGKLPFLDIRGLSCLDFVTHEAKDSIVDLVVIDDLDEIHPDLGREILIAIEQQIRSPDLRYPTRFVVCGRPEGFAPWLAEDKRYPPRDVEFWEIRAPEYRTEGDALLAIEDNLLKRRHRDARTVSNAKTNFLRLVRDSPFFSTTLHNLSSTNYLTEILSEIQPDEKLEPNQIARRLFDAMLERNSESHGRPTGESGEYLSAIRSIAAKYAVTVDRNGFFSVNFTDEVCGFRVRSLLDRSGFVYLSPADFKARRYKFEPSWIHWHLVNQYNHEDLKPTR